MTGELVVGLRFNPKDLPTLREQARRMAADGTHTHMISLLQRAVAATSLGDPVILWSSHLEEVKVLAEGFTAYGVDQPTVEEVRV